MVCDSESELKYKAKIHKETAVRSWFGDRRILNPVKYVFTQNVPGIKSPKGSIFPTFQNFIHNKTTLGNAGIRHRFIYNIRFKINFKF